MTTTIEAVYKAVPWSNVTPGKEFALVDMTQFREVFDNEVSAILFGRNIYELERVANRLNARITEAIDSAPQAPAHSLVLDEDTMNMLERVTVGMRNDLANTIKTDPMISALRKMIAETGDLEVRRIMEETEERATSESVVSKEMVVSDFIKHMYVRGVKDGTVKP